MKKLTLLLSCIVFVFFVNAQQTSQTISLEAGTLKQILSNEDFATITDLTITGTMDARDFNTINTKMRTTLQSLDLSGVEIIYYKGMEGPGWVTSDYEYLANEIPQYGLHEMRMLTSLKIPESVTAIRRNAFWWMGISTLDIPQSVTVIEESVFSSCANLKTIILPDAVTEVSAYLFSKCEKLESVTLSSQTTKIGEYAFNSCRALKKITLPATVSTINTYSFDVCTALEEIYAYNPVPVSISDPTWAFYGVGVLVSCTVYVPKGSRLAYASERSWAKIGQIIEMSGLSIEDNIGESKISIFPNPIINEFSVSNIEGTSQVNIINMNGKIVHSAKVVEGEFVSIESLNPGIYIVEIISENKTIQQKIIKK